MRASQLPKGPPVSLPSWIRTVIQGFLENAIINGNPIVDVTTARFASRYFSSILDFAVRTADGSSHRIFAKFPKAERRRGLLTIPHRLPDDINLALKEFEALQHLARYWTCGRTAWIQPLYYDDTVGGIYFPHVEGQDLWSTEVLRWLRRRGPAPSRWLRAIEDIATDLGAYHIRVSRRSEYDLDATHAKIRQYAIRFGEPPIVSRLRVTEADLVAGIKGFEVRNSRLSAGAVHLFDPGRLKLEPAEADVARFIVSLRMYAWGTSAFVRDLDTALCEERFVGAYERSRRLDRALLGLYLRRETFKNWVASEEVTLAKRVPGVVARGILRHYVAPGFRRICAKSLSY